MLLPGGFPDASPLSDADWCACCFDHDIAYWQGGTRDERRQADIALRECVRAKTGNDALAQSMYRGVRAGGSPYFVSWYRWGYGWGYGRDYTPLTDAERARAETLLQQYFAAAPEAVCKAQ